MEEYEGFDEATLKQMMEEATDYTERSKLRKVLRERKKASGLHVGSKKTGSASYRRPGFGGAGPKTMTIPNSVTGNVLPDRVNMETLTAEKPQSKATISYLKDKAAKPQTGAARRSSNTSAATTTPAPQSPRGSTSSPRESVSSYRSSVTPEPVKSPPPTKSPETQRSPWRETRSAAKVNGPTEPISRRVREPSPEPPKEPTPPPREPTPPPREPTPPPREPTPPPREPTPPPREPTPPPREPTPPPREPTPPPREPTPPPREPTPPPREPTPPPREPTPPPKEPTPPPREPTPEPPPEPVKEPSPEPEPVVVSRRRRSPSPSPQKEEEESEEESEEEEEGESEEESGEESDEPVQDERFEYRSGRSFAASDSKKTGALPTEVLAKEEPGVNRGDFRTKLQKVQTKINTRAAFPSKKIAAEQVDFRNLLKKGTTPEKKTIKSGGLSQTDFRGSLKKPPKEGDQLPGTSPKPPRRVREEVPQENGEKERETPQEEEEPPQEQKRDETDSTPADTQEDKTPTDDSLEARQAERQRRREQRRKELEELGVSEKTESSAKENTEETTSDADSYENRKEARRKAREERLKAAAAKVEEKQEPRLSYRERKQREQLQNAMDSRKKWENREDESGVKTEKPQTAPKKPRDTATQQLLAWCQHKTRGYNNVKIKDFRSSWSDGMAFCAILHSFLPDKIPFDDLSPDNPKRNFTIAFDAAKEAGIPEMLDVEDMLSVRIPDAKSIMTFLVTIYQHFNS